MSGQSVKNIALSSDGSAVRIVDQTLLPGQLRYIELRDRQAMYEAIKKLRVRGAPAIGIFAAYCVYVLARGYGEGEFFSRLDDDCDYLISCRPTAVNLARQVERQRAGPRDAGTARGGAGRTSPSRSETQRRSAHCGMKRPWRRRG